jgi:uncharacterized protein YlxP (DUF503 family)
MFNDGNEHEHQTTQDSVKILLLTIELHLPNAHSLKEKRASIKSCIERLKKSINASVAEIGFTDKWQRSVIALCIVGTDKHYLEKSMSRVENIVMQLPELVIARIERQWL